jgi:hypothetical protein
MPVAIRSKKKPDPSMVKDQLQLLQSMRKDWGTEAFCRYMIWIQAKKADHRSKSILASRYIPFVWNPAQKDFYNNVATNNIVVKGRQMGFTTWILLVRLLLEALLTPGTNSLLISQNSEYVDKHFLILRRAFRLFGAVDPANADKNEFTKQLHENLFHTAYSNRKELIFDQLDNRINIASAENPETGQGVTLSRVGASEVARWPGLPEETLANLKESIVLGGTLDQESTANGRGGYFFEEYDRASRGLSDFKAHFYAWWWDPGYRIDMSPEQEAEMAADLTADEERLRATFNLSFAQILFRRTKQKALRHNFAEKYAEDDVSAFLVGGVTFFDKAILVARQMELTKFKAYTSFSGGKAVVLKPRVKGRKYVIGADVASGKQEGNTLDSSAAKVLDLETGEEMATYLNQLPPEDFGLDLKDLGEYYNDALIAVERSTGAEAGGDGGTVLATLIEEQYPNIYYHKEFIRSKGAKERKISAQPGFPTTGGTRPIILNALRWHIENFPELIWDKMLVKQALLFTRDEKGRPSATEGTHDDMVLATAIAHGARRIELGLWNPLAKLVKAMRRYGAPAVGEEEPEDED